MRLSDLLSMCFSSLFRRKVRTSLTVIGVVIGTCSIVIMVSLGIGINNSDLEMMKSFQDLNTIQVYSNNFGPSMGGNSAENETPKLNEELVNTIKAMNNVAAVNPTYDLYEELSINSGKYIFQGSVQAADINALKEMGFILKEGEFPDENTDQYAILFGEESGYSFIHRDPNKYTNVEYDELGKPLSPPPVDPLTAKINFTIKNNNGENNGGGGYYGKSLGGMGVTIEGGAGGSNSNQDNNQSAPSKSKNMKVFGILKGDYAKSYNTIAGAYIDISLAKKIKADYYKLNNIPKKNQNYDYSGVSVKVTELKYVSEVEEQIKALGYETYSFEQNRKSMEKQAQTMQLILGSLGAISLLVAALGITNTMIMSIYERTREIGVMKVLGCELKNIRTMFLCEAGAIGLFGGLVGIIISYSISFALNFFSDVYLSGGFSGPMGEPATATQISIIPLWLALLGVSFSVLVGIVSGYYPANRAVKISALSAIKQD